MINHNYGVVLCSMIQNTNFACNQCYTIFKVSLCSSLQNMLDETRVELRETQVQLKTHQQKEEVCRAIMQFQIIEKLIIWII